MKKKTDTKPTENVVNEVDEWKTKYVRVLADYQNLDKRATEQINETRKYASEMLLVRLLPVLDTFAKVKEHVKDPGLELALKELWGVLDEQGVVRIDVMGQEFNPHTMECIEVVAGEENIVTEEVRAGYMFRDKLLRPAAVKVGKSQEQQNGIN